MSISHRSKAFEQIFKSAESGVRTLMNIPESFRVLFISAGTEAMERLVQGCSAERTYHFVNGAFSKKFYEVAKSLRREAFAHQVEEGQGYNPADAGIAPGVEMICITQNETSTGVSIPERLIAACKARYPEKLVCVDVVSSAPLVQLDFNNLDACFFSVQKCFGLPAGLGVLIVGPRCLERSQELEKAGRSTGSYHSLLELCRYAEKHQTPATPNVLGIYLLGAVAGDLLEMGIEVVRKEIESRAKRIMECVQTAEGLSLFAKEPYRSRTLIVVNVQNGAAAFKQHLAAKGIEVSGGYGENKERQIRIANFPALSESAVERLVGLLR